MAICPDHNKSSKAPNKKCIEYCTTASSKYNPYEFNVADHMRADHLVEVVLLFISVKFQSALIHMCNVTFASDIVA